MNMHETVATLLAGAACAAADDVRAEARLAARTVWSRYILQALKSAQEQADAAWFALVEANDDLDDEEFDELPAPPEQAALDAIHAEIDAVIKHGRWPRELHWHAI